MNTLLPSLNLEFTIAVARYTPAMVEEICGITPALFLKVAETLCANSGRERTSAFCYAVGWTQHSVGAQYIRTAAIVQLLLGNIGRPGGGIMRPSNRRVIAAAICTFSITWGGCSKRVTRNRLTPRIAPSKCSIGLTPPKVARPNPMPNTNYPS